MTPYIAVGLANPIMKRFNRVREEAIKRERQELMHTSETVQKIIALVCFDFNVTLEQLLSKCRKREYVLARMFCMKLIRDITGLSLVETGKVFNRDHSSVIYNINTLKDLIETDYIIADKYNGIEKLL